MSEGSAFVAAHLDQARALGERLAELIDQPDAYLAALTEGLERLIDLVERRRRFVRNAGSDGTRVAHGV